MKPPLSREAREARRQRNRAGTGRMINDFRPPEGVPLNFEVAGLGMRFAAQTIDILVTGGAVLAFILLLAAMQAPWALLSTLGALLFFLLRAPYYVATELMWNGQTFGKRISRLRVISADGRSLRPYSIAVRNIMKELEVFAPGTYMLMVSDLDPLEYIVLIVWISILLAVPLTNRKRQRLGDMIANTYVIHQPQTLLMPDLTQRAGAEARGKFAFLAHHLDHYGAFELQTLERILHVDISGQRADVAERYRQNLIEVAQKIRTKIGYTDRVAPEDTGDFLEAFYAAQRRYLESRKLFGDARIDKYHKEDQSETAR